MSKSIDTVRDRAHDVVSAYYDRFYVDGRGVVGPIDEDVDALKAALAAAPHPPIAQPQAALHPGSPEVSALLDSVLKKRGWPANPKNAARAGWDAAVQYISGTQPQAAGWRQEIARLRTALRFYARGHHYHLDEREEFDTVSGEPQNWLCSGLEESATMVEDGRVALFALQGIDSNWRDGDDDNTPLPVEGEVSCAPLPEPSKEGA